MFSDSLHLLRRVKLRNPIREAARQHCARTRGAHGCSHNLIAPGSIHRSVGRSVGSSRAQFPGAGPPLRDEMSIPDRYSPRPVTSATPRSRRRRRRLDVSSGARKPPGLSRVDAVLSLKTAATRRRRWAPASPHLALEISEWPAGEGGHPGVVTQRLTQRLALRGPGDSRATHWA